MVDLRINIRIKEKLNIRPSQKTCLSTLLALSKCLLASNSKLRKTTTGKELKNESKPWRPGLIEEISFREVFIHFSVQILHLMLPL